MIILLYSIDNCNDIISMHNFEYLIRYGLLNDKWIQTNPPITQLFVFVTDKTHFYNTFNLEHTTLELIILETLNFNSIDIIKQFYTYINQNTHFAKQNITNIFYVNSHLIGPILPSNEITPHWIDILIDKSNNETRGIKHFSQNMFIFDFMYYKNRIKELKKLPNIDVYFFRKNTMPSHFDYELYKKYLNYYFITSYNTREYLIFHYLKYNKITYDEIEYLVKNSVVNQAEYKHITNTTVNESGVVQIPTKPSTASNEIVKSSIIMEDANESKYIEMILSIIDYDFIRRTDKDLGNITDEQIKHLFLTGKDDIIVSQTHAKLIAQNDLFDYAFYKSHYPEIENMNPTNVLNHYLIYGNYRKDIISHEHAQQLTQIPNFNIDFYKSYHKDLQHMELIQLINHYNGVGKKENRQYN